MLEDEQLAAAYEGLCEIEEEIKQQLTIPAVEKNRSRRCCLLIINTPPLKKGLPLPAMTSRNHWNDWTKMIVCP
ncbi:hypothetical protein [Enterococcus casseliflavus]